MSKLLITCGKLYEVEGDNSIELTRSWESSIDLVDMNCRLKGVLLCQEFGEGGAWTQSQVWRQKSPNKMKNLGSSGTRRGKNWDIIPG